MTRPLPILALVIATVAGLAAAPAQAALPGTVYSNDFEAGVPVPEWSTGSYRTISSAAQGCTSAVFCGTQHLTIGNGVTTLTLSGLPTHDLLQIDMDWFFINSWDGDGQSERIRLLADGVPLMDWTSFSNIDEIASYTQSYPDPLSSPNPRKAAHFNAFEFDTLGSCCSFWGNSVYRFPNADHTFAFPHTGSTVVFTIEIDSSEATADCSNECLGIDNVVVTAQNAGFPVPELGPGLLMGAGVLVVGTVFVAARRRA